MSKVSILPNHCASCISVSGNGSYRQSGASLIGGKPNSTMSDVSILSERALIVGYSMNSLICISQENSLLILDRILVASNECPPISKKLSVSRISSTPKTDENIFNSVRCFSDKKSTFDILDVSLFSERTSALLYMVSVFCSVCSAD